MRSRATPHRHGRLFTRVYLHGLVLLVAVSVAAAAVGWLAAGPSPWQEGRVGLTRYLAGRLQPLLDDRELLAGELAALREAFNAELAVFTVDHHLLAASPGAGLAPESTPPTGEQIQHLRRGFRLAVPLSAGRAYLVAETSWQPNHLRLLLLLGVVLLVLALFSVPAARAIVRPLERLTETAQRLGRGELSARSGIVRRDEVGVLARALDDMADRLALLLRHEKELLANVSHELRTPLARVRIALQLAEETDDLARLRTRLAGIGEDLTELEGLIEDTLAMARLSLQDQAMPQLPLEREPLDLTLLVRDAEQRFAELYSGHVLAVEVNAARLVEGDRRYLRRVLDNLLDNAARYSEADAGPIELVLSGDEQQTQIEIRDRGIGVEPEDLPHLFEPFFRGEKSRARAGGGAGLGLALAARITAAHQGTIVAVPRPQGGLSVIVSLPTLPSGR